MKTNKKMKKKRRDDGAANYSGVWEVKDSPEDTTGSSMGEDRACNLRMSLRDWLLLIPDYDGCPHVLDRFAYSVRYVASRLGEEVHQGTLLLALGAKLRRRARILFEHRLHRYAKVEDLLDGLRGSFGGVGKEGDLLQKLQSAKQKVGESVEEFGSRLDKMASQLCAIYEIYERTDGLYGACEAHKRFAQQTALATFRRGLRSVRLESSIGLYDSESLEDAVRVAVAIDNRMECSRGLDGR